MEAESLRAILAYLAARKGRIIGAFLGFMAGLLWAVYDLWRAAIFLFCVALGYFVGYRVDRKDSWREILEKILPPTE